MSDTKQWWQSRTIWLNLVALTFAILAAFKALPAGLDQQQVLETIMTIVGVISIILRANTTHAIGAGK